MWPKTAGWVSAWFIIKSTFSCLVRFSLGLVNCPGKCYVNLSATLLWPNVVTHLCGTNNEYVCNSKLPTNFTTFNKLVTEQALFISSETHSQWMFLSILGVPNKCNSNTLDLTWPHTVSPFHPTFHRYVTYLIYFWTSNLSRKVSR